MPPLMQLYSLAILQGRANEVKSLTQVKFDLDPFPQGLVPGTGLISRKGTDRKTSLFTERNGRGLRVAITAL